MFAYLSCYMTADTRQWTAGQLRGQGSQPVRGRWLPAAWLLVCHQQVSGHHLVVGPD